ncbi:syntaxin of plants 31 [Artemisia annua]|uniref:Syntaxin of plants 31 n=1 Tax=Artemisia annua TaxID=35608 RepID=A0A2U1MD95_ARTAN|nr:syntaxin of plants 31 [Artemisia annua]
MELEKIWLDMAKKSTIFDDPLKEIQELTVLIKNDITSLNVAVSDLQTLQNMEIASGDYSEDRVVHGTAVCDDLKNKLMGTTKKFQDVLTARTENVKANENRRQIFSTNTRENPLRQQTKTVMEPPPWSSPSKSVGNAQSSESTGTGAQVGNQLRRRVAADGTPSHHMEGSMLQQQVVPQQESYTQNRAVALQSVESTITELSGIFTNLATMVAHQGELSIRIDDNMEETLSHVEGARGALLKHLNRISSNRIRYVYDSERNKVHSMGDWVSYRKPTNYGGLVVSGSRAVKCSASGPEIGPGGDGDDKEKEVHETVEAAESTNSSGSVIADDDKEKLIKTQELGFQFWGFGDVDDRRMEEKRITEVCISNHGTTGKIDLGHKVEQGDIVVPPFFAAAVIGDVGVFMQRPLNLEKLL